MRLGPSYLQGGISRQGSEQPSGKASRSLEVGSCTDFPRSAAIHLNRELYNRPVLDAQASGVNFACCTKEEEVERKFANIVAMLHLCRISPRFKTLAWLFNFKHRGTLGMPTVLFQHSPHLLHRSDLFGIDLHQPIRTLIPNLTPPSVSVF